MIASDLISSQIAPLEPEDTGEQALTMMSIYHVKHLPIIDKNKKLLGVVSEDNLVQHGVDKKLIGVGNNYNDAFVKENDHLFDVLAKIAEYKLTSLPVLDAEDNFVGIIEQEELLQFYANSFSFTEPGSILVLEMDDMDYSLAEISRLVETENAAILSSFLTKVEGQGKSIVTLKINKLEIQKVIATLERFDYTIKASFTEEPYFDDLKERYDSLMKYLNV